MYHKTIKSLQKTYGVDRLQDMINTGNAWRMEGSYGRSAMDALQTGMCMLPKTAHFDFYGNRVPSRDDLQKGSKGTYQNSVRFWSDPDCVGIFDLD